MDLLLRVITAEVWIQSIVERIQRLETKIRISIFDDCWQASEYSNDDDEGKHDDEIEVNGKCMKWNAEIPLFTENVKN